MDFGALPPEVNSARMYSGAGSGPLLAAATAWDGLAAELHSAAAGYDAVLHDLIASAWHGPSAAAMTAATAPYQSWLRLTGGQAEQAAMQARAAAAAYEAAFSATVPPPVIAANRTLLATLIATNFLGQNAAAIAAAEAHYAQMWAQDATAMYTYTGAAAAATRLTPFSQPPETGHANSAAAQPASPGSNAQSTLSNLLSQIPDGLNHLTVDPNALGSPLTDATSNFAGGLNGATDLIKAVDGPYSPLGVLKLFRRWWQVSSNLVSLVNGAQSLHKFFNPAPISGMLTPLLASELLTQAPAALPAALPTVSVAGSIGQAGRIGSLSVPAGWASSVAGATAAPAVQTVAATLPASAAQSIPAAMAAGGENAMFGQMAASSLAGRALSAQAGHAVGAASNRTIGAVTHVTNAATAPDIATTATVIVIPPTPK